MRDFVGRSNATLPRNESSPASKIVLAVNRKLTVPLCRRADAGTRAATPAQRSPYELLGEGTGIRWPEIDEDISVRGMLEGAPAKRPTR